MERIARTADTCIRPKLTVIQGYKVDKNEKIAAEIAGILDGVEDMKSKDRAKVIMEVCERGMKMSRWRNLHWFLTGILAMGLLWCFFN